MTTLENAVLTIEEAAKILGISKKLCYTAADAEKSLQST